MLVLSYVKQSAYTLPKLATQAGSSGHEMTRRIMILVYPGCMSLDIVGPADTFLMANTIAREHSGQDAEPAYDISLIAPKLGNLQTAGSIVTMSIDHCCYELSDAELEKTDLLLISGGVSAIDIRTDPEMLAFIHRAKKHARRIGSICTGAFLLAEAGLLDGRKAATHWRMAKLLKETYPDILVEPSSIVCQDKGVWSSGGITSGIDLALAVIEEDLGSEIARSVARLMVTHLARQGGQNQYEDLNKDEGERVGAADILMREVLNHIRLHPAGDLRVETLAKHFSLTEKTLTRRFKGFTNKTIGKFVEDTRLAHAQARLENSGESLGEVAKKSGFPSTEAMRKAFTKRFSISPAAFRARFRTATKSL